MIFNFLNGKTKYLEIGRRVNGIKDKNGRPISVTLTYKELNLLLANREYHRNISRCLDVSLQEGDIGGE